MNRNFDKMLNAIAVFALLSYVSFMGYRYLYSPYKTMIAYNHVESDSYRSKAVILRDESVFSDVGSTNCYYLLSDATMVKEGQEIAVEYSSLADIKNRERIKAYEQEIACLKNASALKDGFFGTDLISLQTNEVISKISKSNVMGNAEGIDEMTYALTELLNKKQVATGRDDGFNQRVNYLYAQKGYLESQISPPLKTVSSFSGGYFTSKVDGYEEAFDSDNRQNISVDTYLSLINQEEATKHGNNIGKIVSSHNWYIAVSVPKQELKRFKIGARVGLGFYFSNADSIDGIISDIISDETHENSVVLIRCNYVTPELINIRNTTVDVEFKNYSGIRIDGNAIRYNSENEAGVFVIEGNRIVFKRIEIIRQAETYALCDENSQLENSIKLFDEVIVKGTDIYDGKVVQQN